MVLKYYYLENDFNRLNSGSKPRKDRIKQTVILQMYDPTSLGKRGVLI